MTRTERRSERSGISALLLDRPGSSPVTAVTVVGHQTHELVEQMLPIVRAGGRLGVELDGEGRNVEGAQPFNDMVVQSHMGDLNASVAAAS